MQAAMTRRRHSWLFLPVRPIRRLLDLTVFVVKRQWHHPGLTLLALLGIVLAVGLVANASCFSEAASQLILNQKLAEFSRVTGRPPFSIVAYTFPSSRKPLPLEAAERAARHVAETLASEVGLPLEHVGMQVSSGGMMLQPREGSNLYGKDQSLLGSVELAYIAGVEDHMQIIAGEPLDDGVSGEALDVWMHARLAESMGIQIGEELEVGVTMASPAIPIHVRGIWQASDPKDEFWFSNPDSTLKDTFLVRRQDYITFVEPVLPSRTGGVYWHVIMDENKATPASANRHIEGFERALTVINQYLPDVRLDSPPLDPLKEFVGRETTLLTLLLSFNVPALGFLLCFLVLTSVMIARWQRRDTAVLVSRGAGTGSVLALTAVEEFVALHRQKPGNRFVVTSRIVGYRDAPLTGAAWPVYTLVDWGREEIERFARQWTLAFEIATHGDTPEARAAAEQERRDLLAAIAPGSGIERLASNPLLLTIMALIKRQRVTLPRERVKLYELYLETLINAWNKARALDKRPVGPEMDYLETVQVLAPLALWLRETNPTAGLVSREQIETWLTGYYQREWDEPPGPARGRARAFLDGVRRYSNLLVERGEGQYGFLHLTLRCWRPSEEEWERAARGTDGREYPWGGTGDRLRLNCAEWWAGRALPEFADWEKWLRSQEYKEANPTPTAVTTFPDGTGPAGLWDASGNVWEWTASWSIEGELRALRGGSWFNLRRCCRCAYRLDYDPGDFGRLCGVSCGLPWPSAFCFLNSDF